MLAVHMKLYHDMLVQNKLSGHFQIRTKFFAVCVV
jgi:hypothetical protein